MVVTEKEWKGFVITWPNTSRPPPAIRQQLGEQFWFRPLPAL